MLITWGCFQHKYNNSAQECWKVDPWQTELKGYTKLLRLSPFFLFLFHLVQALKASNYLLKFNQQISYALSPSRKNRWLLNYDQTIHNITQPRPWPGLRWPTLFSKVVRNFLTLIGSKQLLVRDKQSRIFFGNLTSLSRKK